MNGDIIMASGATLAMLGIITRGLAAGQQRATSLRKQHDLDVRKPGEALPPVPHLEKHLYRYANGAIVLGLLVVAVGYFS